MSRIQTTTQYEYANSELTYPHIDLIEGLNRRVKYTYKDGTRDLIPINNQEKTVEITRNGEIEILPDSNYTGLSKVIAYIQVAGGGGESSGGNDLEILNIGEYRLKVDNNEIVDDVWYCLMAEETPYELYLGKELIAKRGELESPGFPYTFSWTF